MTARVTGLKWVAVRGFGYMGLFFERRGRGARTLFV